MGRPGQMLRQPTTHRRRLRRLNAATETRRQASLPQRLCGCAASTALFCRHASTLQKRTQGQRGLRCTAHLCRTRCCSCSAATCCAKCRRCFLTCSVLSAGGVGVDRAWAALTATSNFCWPCGSSATAGAKRESSRAECDRCA
jgi:hypothetical protein